MTKRKEFYEDDIERTLSSLGLMPEVGCYVDYKRSKWTGRSNYGSHSMEFYFAGVRMWFSYETLIAFQVDGGKQYVRENDWNVTTGRHLQAAQRGYGERYPSAEFLVLFVDALARKGMTSKLPRLCVYEEKPKAPKLKPLRKIGLRKTGEPVIAPEWVRPKKERMYNHPKKPTRLERLAAGLDFEKYREDLPEEVLS